MKSPWQQFQVCGAILCALSAILSCWLWARVKLSCQRKRLIHRQIATLAFATGCSEIAHCSLWFGGWLDWHRIDAESRFYYCSASEIVWCFTSVWSCLVTFHIVTGILVASRHSFAGLDSFSRTLNWLPLLSLLLMLPALCTRVQFIGEYGEVACMMGDLADYFFCSTISFLFISISFSTAKLLRIVNASAPSSVLRRVSADALSFIAVYFITWLGVVVCHICRLVGCESAHKYMVPCADILASLRGILEALAYARIIRRSRQQGEASDTNGLPIRNIRHGWVGSRFNVAFRAGEDSILHISGAASHEDSDLSEVHATSLRRLEVLTQEFCLEDSLLPTSS